MISAAAGEVARLKLGSYEPHLPRQNPTLLRRQNAAFQPEHCLQQQRILDQMWICSQSQIKSSKILPFPKRVTSDEVALENMRYMRHRALSNSPWLPQNAGTTLKRPSAGTGVFLPRRYPTPPSDSYKKPGTITIASPSLYEFYFNVSKCSDFFASYDLWTVTVNTTTMPQSKVHPQILNFDESRRNQFDYGNNPN